MLEQEKREKLLENLFEDYDRSDIEITESEYIVAGVPVYAIIYAPKSMSDLEIYSYKSLESLFEDRDVLHSLVKEIAHSDSKYAAIAQGIISRLSSLCVEDPRPSVTGITDDQFFSTSSCKTD